MMMVSIFARTKGFLVFLLLLSLLHYGRDYPASKDFAISSARGGVVLADRLADTDREDTDGSMLQSCLTHGSASGVASSSIDT